MNPKGTLAIVLVTILTLFANSFPLHADELDDVKKKVAVFELQIESLKAENEALKKENQSLRRLVDSGKSQPTTPSAPSTPATTSTTVPVPAPAKSTAAPSIAPAKAGYWITTSSGIRHNSSCRYYGTSKGRSCGPTEGRACKICGG